ncbi:hypothetical protein AJ88_26080 [Mesorhizobium amorphae CCBAU 01583]|nr:hypothetical protein AJ88_26080 [Mesorhizobium amorphae CCBAU 01583]
MREPLVSRIMDEFMLPPFQANPYNIALPAIMKSLVLADQLYGFKGPLEVIFDKQSGIEAPFLRAWEGFYETLSHREKEVFESRPRFERDEKFLPLQAADLQAYWIRDYCKKGGKLRGMPNPYPWHLKHPIACIIIEPEENQIRQVAASYRVQYIKQRASEAWQTHLFPMRLWTSVALRRSGLNRSAAFYGINSAVVVTMPRVKPKRLKDPTIADSVNPYGGADPERIDRVVLFHLQLV